MSNDAQQTIQQAKRLIERLRHIQAAHADGYTPSAPSVQGIKAQVVDFLSTFAGPKSPFVRSASDTTGADHYIANILVSIVEGFIDHVENGLLAAVSPERKAQLDVVSDLLGQSQRLLEDSKVHPAAPTVLIGASLEEFLRSWMDAAGLSLGSRKPGIANYATVLREADLIQKQDVKDIESWGGLRNHAAHGEWDQVSDRSRIKIMLEGVNLFMRSHS